MYVLKFEYWCVTDEYWSHHPELHDIPIYYASSLAKKCMSVYQTYINAMNDRIRRQINTNNPFVFKHISNLKVRCWYVMLPFLFDVCGEKRLGVEQFAYLYIELNEGYCIYSCISCIFCTNFHFKSGGCKLCMELILFLSDTPCSFQAS